MLAKNIYCIIAFLGCECRSCGPSVPGKNVGHAQTDRKVRKQIGHLTQTGSLNRLAGRSWLMHMNK